MPLDPYLQKALLDWTTGAASVTQPTGRFLGFASGSPSYTSDSAAPMYRATVTFQSASTGTEAVASNKAGISCSATAVCTLYGWNLFDATSGGNRLMYGTLTATVTAHTVGDQIYIAAAGLTITMA